MTVRTCYVRACQLLLNPVLGSYAGMVCQRGCGHARFKYHYLLTRLVPVKLAVTNVCLQSGCSIDAERNGFIVTVHLHSEAFVHCAVCQRSRKLSHQAQRRVALSLLSSARPLALLVHAIDDALGHVVQLGLCR